MEMVLEQEPVERMAMALETPVMEKMLPKVALVEVMVLEAAVKEMVVEPKPVD